MMFDCCFSFLGWWRLKREQYKIILKPNNRLFVSKEIFIGVLFAVLWSSAPIATKFGLRSCDPLLLASFRFLAAGVCLLIYVYGIRRGTYRLPEKREWIDVTILGLLNSTIYLGAFFTALNFVTAGLSNLFIAANPIFITLIAALWLKRPVKHTEWVGMAICFGGLVTACIPTLQTSSASVAGILILGGSIVSMSVGSVYFSKIQPTLPTLVINTWQVSIGGLALLPVALLTNDISATRLDENFIGSLVWIVVAVSIGAMGLWFYLLNQDPVKASLWLFLVPVAGYILAAIFLDEPITLYALGGTALVLVGLSLARRRG
jgi:drug/metabolite transporter (DMT)-like permease